MQKYALLYHHRQGEFPVDPRVFRGRIKELLSLLDRSWFLKHKPCFLSLWALYNKLNWHCSFAERKGKTTLIPYVFKTTGWCHQYRYIYIKKVSKTFFLLIFLTVTCNCNNFEQKCSNMFFLGHPVYSTLFASIL